VRRVFRRKHLGQLAVALNRPARWLAEGGESPGRDKHSSSPLSGRREPGCEEGEHALTAIRAELEELLQRSLARSARQAAGANGFVGQASAVERTRVSAQGEPRLAGDLLERVAERAGGVASTDSAGGDGRDVADELRNEAMAVEPAVVAEAAVPGQRSYTSGRRGLLSVLLAASVALVLLSAWLYPKGPSASAVVGGPHAPTVPRTLKREPDYGAGAFRAPKAAVVQVRLLASLAEQPVLRRTFVMANGLTRPGVSAKCVRTTAVDGLPTFRCVVWQQPATARGGASMIVSVAANSGLKVCAPLTTSWCSSRESSLPVSFLGA